MRKSGIFNLRKYAWENGGLCAVFLYLVMITAGMANQISISGSCSYSATSSCAGRQQISHVNSSECTDIERVIVGGKYCFESCMGQAAPGYYMQTVTRPVIGLTNCIITFYAPYACDNPGTSAGGSTSQTSCYIPSGKRGTDSSGSYTYTGNCYWKN